jgi:general stress protein YciG
MEKNELDQLVADQTRARSGAETTKVETVPTKMTRPRGFAALTPEQRRELGSRGGKSAHERGTANKFDSVSASEAGRIPHLHGTAHKWTSDEARLAGRKGGSAARKKRRATPSERVSGE